jgi:hypothetical protein
MLAGPQQINAGKGFGEAGSRTLVCVQPCKTSPIFCVFLSTNARRAFILVANRLRVLLKSSRAPQMQQASMASKL